MHILYLEKNNKKKQIQQKGYALHKGTDATYYSSMTR